MTLRAVLQNIRCTRCETNVSVPELPEHLSPEQLMGEILRVTEAHKAVCPADPRDQVARGGA